MVESNSKLEHPIDDDNVKTAIFYSISDLGDYLIEICHQRQHYFIEADGKQKQFGNMDSAKKAAIDEGAKQGFIALSKTYQEVESETISLSSTKQESRYDYIRIDLTSYS